MTTVTPFPSPERTTALSEMETPLAHLKGAAAALEMMAADLDNGEWCASGVIFVARSIERLTDDLYGLWKAAENHKPEQDDGGGADAA